MKRRAALVIVSLLAPFGFLLWRHEGTVERHDSGRTDAAGDVAPAPTAVVALPAMQAEHGPDASAPEIEPEQGALEPLDCNAPEGNVATVDGEGVPAAELCADWRRLSGPTDQGDPTVMDKQGKALLEGLIAARLVDRALTALGKPVTEGEVDTALLQLVALRGVSRRAYEQSLRDEGVDLAMLRRDLKRRTALQKLVELRGDLEPTSEEIQAAYAADPTRWGTPKTATLEVFLARAVPTAPAQDRAQALASAQAFSAGLSAGEAPGELAKRHGLVATPPIEVTAEGVEAELSAVAFGLAPGQWSQPVQTRAGWSVARLVKMTEGKARPLAQVRDPIRDRLMSERKLSEQRRVVAELRAASKVVQLQW